MAPKWLIYQKLRTNKDIALCSVSNEEKKRQMKPTKWEWHLRRGKCQCILLLAQEWRDSVMPIQYNISQINLNGWAESIWLTSQSAQRIKHTKCSRFWLHRNKCDVFTHHFALVCVIFFFFVILHHTLKIFNTDSKWQPQLLLLFIVLHTDSLERNVVSCTNHSHV